MNITYYIGSLSLLLTSVIAIVAGIACLVKTNNVHKENLRDVENFADNVRSVPVLNILAQAKLDSTVWGGKWFIKLWGLVILLIGFVGFIGGLHQLNNSSVGKNEIPNSNGRYKVIRLQKDHKEYILRCDSWLNRKSYKDFNYQLGIATTLKTSKDSYPTVQENQYLFKLEDNIIKLYEDNKQAVYAGTITGGGIKEFYLYTDATQEARIKFDQIKKEFPDYPLQLLIQYDPQWETYSIFCPKQ